jgi:hypothetical protein
MLPDILRNLDLPFQDSTAQLLAPIQLLTVLVLVSFEFGLIEFDFRGPM